MKTASFNQGPRVLVVDDHRISRLHTVQALRQVLGHVKQARTAKEAMHSALAYLPELIFMDIHLADSNGLSLLENLRQSWPAHSTLPAIVILTGDNSRGLRQKLEKVSVSAILLKPVHSEHIRTIAVQLLQLDRAVRENPGQGQAEAPEPGLHRIFLEEMNVRLPELDRCITNLDWDSARHILHQLIASSAICQEKELEQHCRKLFTVLDKYPQPHALAQAYYPFRQVLTQMKILSQAV
jgi:CheY-like chemotaxis protein